MRTSHHLPPSVMGVKCIHKRAPEGEVIIVDGSAMVNSTPPRTSKTFEDYAREDILPKNKFNGATYKRVDEYLMLCKGSLL